MNKNEIIRQTGGILKELAFLRRIHNYPKTLPFIDSVLEFMQEELDIETCEKIRVGFMNRLRDRRRLFEGR